MMDFNFADEALLKIAIIVSILGLVMLLIIMYITPIKNVSVSNINEMIAEKIIVNGTIDKISYSNNKTTFFSLSSKCSINVIIFNNIRYADLNIGENISVIGKAQEYQGKTSIIADKIEVTR